MITVTQIPQQEVFRSQTVYHKQPNTHITSRTSPLRTSQVAINPPANKLDDVRRRQTIMSSARKSGVKSAKSTGIDEGFQKHKKDIGSIVGSGTITNDSLMQ